MYNIIYNIWLRDPLKSFSLKSKIEVQVVFIWTVGLGLDVPIFPV